MNEERTVTIPVDEYKALIKSEIRLSLVTQLVEDTDSKYSVDKDDLCRILGIKLDKEEEA